MLRFIWKFFHFLFVIFMIAVVLLLAGLAYVRFVEPNRLTTTELQYTSSSIAEPVTVAIFADTHFGFLYDLESFQKFIDRVNENPPDLLLFAGDLIDNLNEYQGDTALISQKLNELNANVGKFAVFGNHDYGGGAEHRYEQIMNDGGFRVLKNEMVSFSQYNLRLIGIDDILIGYGNPAIVSQASRDMYNLVLCHEPDVVEQLGNSHVNYMVAGHTHGGQFRIPFYTQQFLPSYGEAYIKGEYQVNDMILYVTAGLGTTKIPVRFRSVPELTYITFSSTSMF